MLPSNGIDPSSDRGRADGRLPAIVAKKPKPRTRTGRATPPADPLWEALTPQQQVFCLAYLENGFNATRAYMAAHPSVSYQVAQTEAWRNLRKPKIAAYLRTRLDEAWKPLAMGGDEALARIAFMAKADIRCLFTAAGVLKKPHEWPEEIAELVEAVEFDKGKVKLASKGFALRIILEQTGKLKTLPDSIDALAEAIKADLVAHGHEPNP